MATTNDDAVQVLEACVAHGRQMLASQLPILESCDYDFVPSFKELTTQLYLAGVMWRFGEQFDMPTAARDRGFICLMSMLVGDGMSAQRAQERIAHLNQVSRNAQGTDVPVMLAGYGAKEADGSLANVFAAFRQAPEVSGAPYRLLDRAKPIAAGLAFAGMLVSFLLGKSWWESIGVGVILGVAALAAALVIYRQVVKKHRP